MVVVVIYHRKIRPTQLWVELSWVVAKTMAIFAFVHHNTWSCRKANFWLPELELEQW